MQRLERIVESTDIQHADRLLLRRDLLVGKLAVQLVERAVGSGQRRERVRALRHERLAFGKVGRIDQVVARKRGAPPKCVEPRRHDADDAAARIMNRAGDDAHEPGIVSAEHERMTPSGHGLPE